MRFQHNTTKFTLQFIKFVTLLALTLPFQACSLLQSGKPLKSVAFPEFRSVMPRSNAKYNVITKNGFDRELHRADRPFDTGNFQVSIETVQNGDSLELVTNVTNVVMNGWLERAWVRVIPTKQLPLRARDNDIDDVLRTRRGRLSELTRDFAKARFSGKVSFRPVELLWHPHEFNPTSQEASDFVISVLLQHRGGGFTRKVYYHLATRPKQGL